MEADAAPRGMSEGAWDCPHHAEAESLEEPDCCVVRLSHGVELPTRSVKRLLKVPSDEQPTAKQTSVTLRSPRRSSAIARSIRRVIR
jgi:hypothetical protein